MPHKASKPKPNKKRDNARHSNPIGGKNQSNQIPAGGTNQSIKSNKGSKQNQKKANVTSDAQTQLNPLTATIPQVPAASKKPRAVKPSNNPAKSTPATSKFDFMTNIKQINLQKKKSACKTYFKELKCNDIMLCQEPYTHKNKLSFVPNTHKSFSAYHKDGSVRAAIITPRELGNKSFILSPFSSRDIISIKCNHTHKGRKTILCSVYMAHEPNKPDIDPEVVTKLENLVLHAKNNNTNLIVGIDCNGHHKLWNSTSNSPRGKKVAALINKLNLDLLNKGDLPTFVNTRGHSTIIDITLSNSLSTPNIKKWSVAKEASLSDHKMITVSFDYGNEVRTKYRNYNTLDESVFKKEVMQQLADKPFIHKIGTEVSAPTTITKNMEFLNNILSKALDMACPETYIVHKSKCPWNKELTKIKKKVKKAKNKAIATSNNKEANESARKHLAEIETDFKKEIRNTNQDAYRKYCSELKGHRKLAKTTKPKRNHWEELNTLKNKDGILTCSSKETLETLMDEHFPQPTLRQPTQPPREPTDKNMIDEIIDLEKITGIVKKLKNGKAPGLDNIKNEMIKLAWEQIDKPIIHIFKQCLLHSCVPDCWKTSKGIIIPKTNKDDYCNPRAFRIMSLTSNLQKLLEKAILDYLENKIRIDNKLTKNQFGFRRKRGTDAALHKLTRRIEDSLQNGQYSLGIFLDIEGAFDAIKFDSIRKGLQEAKVPSTIIQWIYTMLTEREIVLELHGVKIKRKIWKGCPQGGILSPLLWNITLNSLLLDSRLDKDFLQAFADDLCILIQGTDLNMTMRNIASKYIAIIDKWCSKNGVKISTLKTQTIVFSNINKKYNFKPIQTKEGNLKVESYVKYLGVIFDKHLRFDEHIRQKCASASKALRLMRNHIGKHWGITPRRMRWIYRQVVLPMISYTCFIWIHRADESIGMHKLLEGVQKQANLMITGGFKTTPNITLDILARNTPIKIWLDASALKTLLRLKTNNSWIQCNIHSKNRSHATLLKNKAVKIETLGLMPNDLISETEFSPLYSVTKVELEDQKEDHINIYYRRFRTERPLNG